MIYSHSRTSCFRKVGSGVACEPSELVSYGDLLDSKRADVLQSLNEALGKQAQLEMAGCSRGHIHFKSDERTMFMYLPVDSAGHRQYIHIGVNPEKQLVARQEVAREQKRAGLAASVSSLAAQAEELESRLCSLIGDYDRLQRLQQNIKDLIATPDAGEYENDSAC